MDQGNTIKKYPVTTSEVAKMLGIKHPSTDLPLGNVTLPVEAISTGDLPVVDLPIEKLEAVANNHEDVEKKANFHSTKPEKSEASNHDEHSVIDKNLTAPLSPWARIGKASLPYVAVFSVGLFLYYFFFSATDFSSIFKSKSTPSTSKQTAMQQLAQEQSGPYQAWMRGFYYDISDSKIIDPDADNSGNGLSNFEKYLLNLNPKSYDTLGLGVPDSQAIALGISPTSGANLTEDQKQVIAKYVDMEVVMNRLALNHLRPAVNVAGAAVGLRGLEPRGLQNLTNYNQPAPVSSAMSSQLDINTDIPGRLEIPSLKVNAPIIWSKAERDFNNDLQKGVIHYPGTAMPGQIGTTYISGHSSNYAWAKGDYNYVFTHLGDLANNTSFKVTVAQKNGKDAILHYVVTNRKQYSPTDSEQYQNTDKSVVALSTCWPVGSTAKRLVVFGELTQVEK